MRPRNDRPLEWPAMASTTFLTGALGCIGAWVVKTLTDRGEPPVVFDLSDDHGRLLQVLDEEELAGVRFVRGDITDPETVSAAIADSGADRVIHLAGLQVPFCRADPGLGARVNVVGTVNVFQGALAAGVGRVVYASSAAVYGPPHEGDGAPDESAACEPATHYGVYKRANEGTARIYFQDEGLPSVGLRPLTVYGVGRDQGLTSGPTRAMKAAVLGRAFVVPFTGATDFNYVADTAAAFVAAADGPPADRPDGAHVFNLHGDSVEVGTILGVVDSLAPGAGGTAGCLRAEGPAIPIPPALDGAAFRSAYPQVPATPLEEGVAATLGRFAHLRDAGRLATHDLEG